MDNQKVMNRWLVVVGGILVQLCLGAIYAWSAFTAKLQAAPYEFSKTQTQYVFAAGLASFAIVMAMFAGRWQAKSGPRVVSIAGGLVMGLGYVIAGFAGESFWLIFLGVGVIGGGGIGLAYVCPIAALMKWFPDKKGMITGLAVAGFGFGALIWVKLTNGFVFGPINLTPGWDGLFGAGMTVNQIFMWYGIAFAAVITIGSLFMVNPPEGWLPKGFIPPTAAQMSRSGGVNYTPRQMVCSVQFWSIFSIFTFGAIAGLMVIGIIKLFGNEQLAANGMEVKDATLVTGTAMGLFFALANGLGRILWGTFSDILGRRKSIALMSFVQGLTMIAFYFVGGHVWGLYAGAALIGFNFGGNFALFPAVTADIFGNKSVGTNYPFVFLAYGVGGIVGPILGGAMGDAQSWMWAFIPAGIACIVGSVIALTLAPAKQSQPVTNTSAQEAISAESKSAA